MSTFKNLTIRPLRAEDVGQLDAFRRTFQTAWLELPHGMAGEGVETAVAEKNGEIIGSLTGVGAVVMDPFIRNPNARGVDIFAAVVALERALAYNARKGGIVDAYIAVPKGDTEYIEICKKAGYDVTCQDCVILRRPLIPDVVPLLEDEAVTPKNDVK